MFRTIICALPFTTNLCPFFCHLNVLDNRLMASTFYVNADESVQSV